MERKTLHHNVMQSKLTSQYRSNVLPAGLRILAICLLTVVGCAPIPYVVGLKPESPLPERESKLDSVRPTFRWESFPRAKDLAQLGPQGRDRITTVTYEIRLWKVGKEFPGIDRSGRIVPSGWFGANYGYKYDWKHECRDTNPGELVYAKQGLVNPYHMVELSLDPDAYYFWSIRAHFRLDGNRRVTEWSEQVPSPDSLFYGVLGLGRCSAQAHFHLVRTPS